MCGSAACVNIIRISTRAIVSQFYLIRKNLYSCKVGMLLSKYS